MRKFKKKQAGFLLNPFRFGGAAPSGDPFFANVSYLTHAGGANNSIVLTDSANTPVVLARTGTPVISTAQSRFGEASIAALSTGYFGGSDPDFAFGTGDFTIECWLYWVTASGATQPGAFQVCTTTGGVQASAVNNIALLCNSGSTYAIYANSRSMASAAVIATGVWAHTAIVRTAGVITLYVNGAVILSEADTNNYAGTGIAIGGYYSTAYNFDGYIDEFRVTKGVARYTAAFTPPTQAFPDAGSATDPFFANVMLLTHFNGVNGATTTVDSSSKARALTVNGAVSLSDAQVKFGTAASLFAGGYWTSPASADFAFPGDFTIEFQARKSANGTNGYDMVMLTDTSNGSATNGWFVELSSLRGFVFAYAGALPVVSAQNPNDSLYHHWAVSRTGGTIYLFKDGVLLTSAAFTTSVLAQGQFGIGRNDISFSYPFAGHIDEIRITKGVGRYTANFTPPTAAFPDS